MGAIKNIQSNIDIDIDILLLLLNETYKNVKLIPLNDGKYYDLVQSVNPISLDFDNFTKFIRLNIEHQVGDIISSEYILIDLNDYKKKYREIKLNNILDE